MVTGAPRLGDGGGGDELEPPPSGFIWQNGGGILCAFRGYRACSLVWSIRLVSAGFLSQNIIKSAKISRLSDQPNTPN